MLIKFRMNRRASESRASDDGSDAIIDGSAFGGGKA